MARTIRLRRGLDISLAGKAEKRKMSLLPGRKYSFQPGAFVGVVPKVVVKAGERVKAGTPLFCSKTHPEVTFASPVSGVVTAIDRGERRRVLGVRIDADERQDYVDYGVKTPENLSGDEVKAALLDAGLFGYINQLPYAVSTHPATTPKGIFISALRDMPLAGDFEYELSGQERDFQAGLTALSKIAKTYLGVGAKQTSNALLSARDVEVTIFDGPCPAGNVDVQINHIDPVNKGEVVWTVEPTAVIFFGRLFNSGKVDLRRTVALAGSEVTAPCYAEMTVGQEIAPLLKGNITEDGDVRIIDGNPLTGRRTTRDAFLGAHTSEITVIPEGSHADEFAGWIMPRTGQFSTSRSYFSWLFKKKEYTLDARIKGGKRHIIMSGEYDRMLPMDIYGEYLVKAIITGDIDKMEQLGIYEVAPEDFALAEFVDSSKQELQSIVRQGLDMLRKENE